MMPGKQITDMSTREETSLGQTEYDVLLYLRLNVFLLNSNILKLLISLMNEKRDINV